MKNKISKMKKRCMFILSISCFFLLSVYPVMAASDKKDVIYQVDQNYAPLTYTNNNGIYGFDPDFTNLIFNSRAYNIKYSFDSWDKVYERLVKGEVDIAGIIAVTEERKKEVLFTKPLFSSSVSVYTRSNFKKIKLEELSQLSVGVGKGYYTEEILKNKLKISNYTTYGDMNQALEDLEHGVIDVIFEDHWMMNSALIASKNKGSVIAQIEHLYPLPHAYAISKSRPELVKYMNERIEVLKKRGIFDELYMEYFYSHSDYYLKNQKIQIISIISAVGIAIIIIISVMKIYIDFLKKKLSINYTKLEQANQELEDAHETLQSQYEEIQAQYEEIQAQFEEIQAQCEEIDVSKKHLEVSEERYRLIAECANDGLFDWSLEEDVLYLSEKWMNYFGLKGTSIVGFSSYWKKLVNKEHVAQLLQQFEACSNNNQENFSTEIQIKTAENEHIWVAIKGKLIRSEDGGIVRMAGSVSDVNEHKKYEDRIYRLAYYDNLTNLPNRVSLNETMERVLKAAKEEQCQCMAAIYYVDLDDFKHINDTLGHSYGDLLLKLIARELLLIKQAGCSVFRAGGDEFIIILDQINGKEEISLFADRILELLRKEWSIQDCEAYVSASIGITVIPEDGTDAEKILKNADAAMYVAKASGKGKYKYFHEDMLHRVEKRSELEQSIRKAIEREEFEVFYQPYYNVAEERMVGMEALIRWFHPLKGMISPAEFIPVAEETGLIREIGHWVLEKVCYQNKEWQKRGLCRLPIAVNVSELQLEDRDFISELKEIIRKTDLDPRYLHIEITESNFMQSIDDSIETLDRIRKLGIEIALDDFGTGYSSLNYLQHLPIKTVKIDKSFIDEIMKRSSDALILSEIISIAHKLSMHVIAEGVEHRMQVDYLAGMGCDMIQGYYYSKPLSVKQIEMMLLEARNGIEI